MPLPFSRRVFLGGLAASTLRGELDKGRVFPSDIRRFPDPATEFDVHRLTDPGYSSHLTASYNRGISRRGNFLLFSCDRTGSNQVYRMDLKTGETRQLTSADSLDPASICLVPDDHSFCFFDGPSLMAVQLNNLKERRIYEVPDGWKRTPGFSVTIDGLSGVLGETQGTSSRLMLVALAKGIVTQLAEAPFLLEDPQARPKRAQVLYRQGDEALWLVNFDGKQNRRLRMSPGKAGPARWSFDGRTVLYLNYPSEPGRLNALRELTPDENQDKMIAPTSQFVQFGSNSDGSVFVGASRNKASPHVLILLRVTRRELTMCEHRSSDPAAVAPVFSPDSQRIFFQSDKQGKPSIYRVAVEKFVEKTDEESSE